MVNFLRAMKRAAVLCALPLICVSAMANSTPEASLAHGPLRVGVSSLNDASPQDSPKSTLLHFDDGLLGPNQRKTNAGTALPAARPASGAITPGTVMSMFSPEPVTHVDDEPIASPSVILASLAMVVLIALRRMAG